MRFAAGMMIGLAMGASVGVALGDFKVGLVMGCGLAVVFGVAVQRADRDGNGRDDD